ncbi:pilus assembly PilX family protein [Undibacterium sp. Rencai35W]|uniref:pilus assembly PilX family protein n=1 Tax=Undibacterium sp. Rencai35W TaxID=3413046 RepID=UPI003BF160B3
MKRLHKTEMGFVLATSMIFLVIMTLLAITAIRRATLDEKVAGNLREQNLAFQAAERALRYCQNDLETVQTIIVQISPPPLIGSTMPTLWTVKTNWGTGGIATTLPAGTVLNVVSQPQCMIEKWQFRPKSGVTGQNKGSAYLITARGVGATNSSVVWLQVAVRPGT